MLTQIDAANNVQSVDVTLVLRNDLQRREIQCLLGLVPLVSTISEHADLASALPECGLHPGRTLMTSLRDVAGLSEAAASGLRDRGVRILLLVSPHEVEKMQRVPDSLKIDGYVSLAGICSSALSDALSHMAAGGVPMPPWMAENLLSAWRSLSRASRPEFRLTPREQETLVLMVDGCSNKQIGRRLGISDHGAKRLVGNILAKLDCPNRTSVAVLALRDGLYDQCRQDIQSR